MNYLNKYKLIHQWMECIDKGDIVWPTLFLLNVFTALKEPHFYILFVVTAACVVPCGSPKSGPVHRP